MKLSQQKNCIETCIKGHDFPFDTNASILTFIEQQANVFPQQSAIICGDQSYSYQELITKVKCISSQLENLGIKKNSTIAVSLTPSCELIIIILAVLNCKAHYLPIDASYPQQRIKYMLTNSQAHTLISDSTYHQKIPKTIKHIKLAQLDFKQDIVSAPQLLYKLNDKQPAYLIYTSGSTGDPKGILVDHTAVNNHMLWMKETFNLTHEDRFLLKTPLSFDPSVWEIFLPLYLGATLVIAESNTHADPQLLTKYIYNYRITVIQLVPVILHKLLSYTDQEKLNTLEYVFSGGESLSVVTKQLFFNKLNCQLVNLYGPAEATIDTTYHIVNNTKQDIYNDIIGKPIFNTQVFVLNDQLSPCSANETGELYIAGYGLSLGYIDKQLSSEAFVTSPLDNQTLLYKTGDLVKFDEQRNLHYIGRNDNQIKINGARVELNSIKNTISEDTNIYACFFEQEFNETYQFDLLTCYLVLVKNNHINIDTIRHNLLNKFPEFMIPKRFCIVKDMPISCNGKLNFKEVKAYYQRKNKAHQHYKSDIQEQVINIWKSILKLDTIDEHKNFADYGGDSIFTIVLVHELSKTYSVNISPEDILQHQTIQSQVQLIQARKKSTLCRQQTNPIVRLNQITNHKIFLVHPIGGTVFWYTHLAKILENEITLYGIQDPGILTGNTLFTSLREMAVYYVTELQKHQPHGPYHIGGASFGATVAIEMAKYLSELGKPVETIYILDGWAVYPTGLKQMKYFRQSMKRQQADWHKKFKNLNIEIPYQQQFFSIQQQRLSLLFNYSMKPVPFHIELFKASEIMPIFKSIDNPTNHWNNYLTDYNLHMVTGNHETMFLPKNVTTIAQAMLDRMLRQDVIT